jgi:hypothetical protein
MWKPTDGGLRLPVELDSLVLGAAAFRRQLNLRAEL